MRANQGNVMEPCDEQDRVDAEFEALVKRLDLERIEWAEAERLLRHAENERVSPAWIDAIVERATAPRPLPVLAPAPTPARPRLPLAAAALAGLLLCTAAVTVVQLWGGRHSVNTLSYPGAVALLQAPHEPESKRTAALGFVSKELADAAEALRMLAGDPRVAVEVRAGAGASVLALKRRLVEGPFGVPASTTDSLREMVTAVAKPEVATAERLRLLTQIDASATAGIVAVQRTAGSPRIDRQRPVYIKKLLRALGER